MNRKAMMWPVVISVFLHLSVLAVTGAIDLRNDIKFEDVLSVTLEKAVPEKMTMPSKPKKQSAAIKEKRGGMKAPAEKGLSGGGDDEREETIDLGSTDIKYVSYLARIKRKIMEIWEYPTASFQRNEEGVVVVKMTIDADGRLAGVTLVTSSGFSLLDDGALSVVQKAAPFDPLPEIYDLSRLNIIATFRYKITD